MLNDSLPKRLFEKNLPLTRPIISLKRGKGQLKISAVLAIAAVIIATTLTVLLMKNATS